MSAFTINSVGVGTSRNHLGSKQNVSIWNVNEEPCLGGVYGPDGHGRATGASVDELDTLKEKGVMRIAMTGAYPPFNFVNE